ncbi:alkene reductase [Desulfuromonas sp. TF]|uniref:alkene reductase n=1 Tax=Desulfuromonas sp. TF TaxID=1232410 RepID=UPI0003FFD243|nr:alkene reductase [Desulfuromonas sp. TF]
MKNIQRVNENKLFTPIQVGRHALPNRIVMAPMTRNRAGSGNIPRDMNVEYYAQRASAGLIITEGSQVSPQGVGYPGTPGIHSFEQVAGWKQITDAVHHRGGRIFLQLWHVGRISHPSLQPNGMLPVAPSAIRPEGEAITHDGKKPFVTPRALEFREIPGIVAQFREAAKNALAAGFDGVEIHAANGYLLDQFLRDSTNRRTDAYGGSLENRVRLLLEVTEAVTEVWGADRVGVRFSPINSFNSLIDSDPDATFGYAADRLNRFSLAFLHVVENDFGGFQTRQTYDRMALRRAFSGTYIANGGYDRARAGQSLADASADLVSFGNLYIANPDLSERFAENAELNVPDPSTFYGGDERGYIDYPFLAPQPAPLGA